MIDTRTASHGAFLLRVSLGVMFLAHALLLKLATFGLSGTVAFFTSLGLPAWTAHATIAAETIGGLLLVAGVWSRLVVVAVIPVLLGALWVHSGNGWVFNAPNGGWEYPLFLTIVSIVVALLGDGAYALKPTPGLAAMRARRLSSFDLA
jgi:putative oxidoreductase